METFFDVKLLKKTSTATEKRFTKIRINTAFRYGVTLCKTI